MPTFIDSDQAYLDWLDGNAQGFVLNSQRTPRPGGYVRVHRATCAHITGTPSNGKRWTDQWIKVCSLIREDLDAWAAKEGMPPISCPCLKTPQ